MLIYRFIELKSNVDQIIDRSQRLVDGHSLCVPYEPTEQGVAHRNQYGQLDMYVDANDQATEVVLGAQFEILLFSCLSLFLIKVLYNIHGVDFWGSTRARIMLFALTVPVFILIGRTS